MKTGYKTTEFWVTVATDVGLLAASIQGSLPPKWAGICTAISTLAYALSRGLTKGGPGGATKGR